MGNAITAVAKLRSAEASIETFIPTALWKNGFSYLGTHVQWRQVLDIWKHKIVAGQLEGLEYVDKNDKGQPLDRPFYKQNSDDVMLDWNQCTLASTDRTDKMCFGKVFPVAKKNHDPPREGPGAGPGDSPNGARLDKQDCQCFIGPSTEQEFSDQQYCAGCVFFEGPYHRACVGRSGHV